VAANKHQQCFGKSKHEMAIKRRRRSCQQCFITEKVLKWSWIEQVSKGQQKGAF